MSTFNDESDNSKVLSAEMDENTRTEPFMVEFGKDPEEEIKQLERQRRDLQDELTAIRRALPIIKDAKGKDITQEMLDLASEYQKYKNENDELHEDLERARQEGTDLKSDLIRVRAECRNKLREMESRISHFEKENAELREIVDSEAKHHEESSVLTSSMYSNRDNEIVDLKRMALDKMNKISDLERQLLENRENEAVLQSDLQTMATENTELKKKIEEMEQTVVEQKKEIKMRNQAIKGYHKTLQMQQTIDTLGESNIVEGNDEIDLCSQLLLILRKLKSNWKENGILYNEIKDFIKEHGGKQADDLESLSESFYKLADERARKIQQTYKSDMERQKNLNSSLLGQLNRVDQTSVCDDEKSNASSFKLTHEANVDVMVNLAENDFSYAINTGDLQSIKEQVSVLKKWCLQYFEKLKVLTTMVQTLLEELMETEEGHSMLQRINNLYLDMNKTVDYSGKIFFEFEKTERNIQLAIEQSMHMTNQTNRLDNEEKDVSITSSVNDLQARKENLKLRNQCTELKQQLHDVIDEKEEILLGKKQIEQELILVRDDLQMQRDSIETVRRELEETNERFNRISDEFSRYRRQVEQSELTDRADILVKVGQLSDAKVELLEKLKEVTEEFDQYKTQVEGYNKKRVCDDLQMQRDSIEALRQELEEANKKFNQVETEFSQYKNQVIQSEQQNRTERVEQLRDENVKLNEKLKQLTEEFAQYKAEVEKYNKKRAEIVERNNATMQKELSSIYKSMSDGASEINKTFSKKAKKPFEDQSNKK